MRHIHLDPLGGIAGDMFAAALLHAFPEHTQATLAAAARLSGATCDLVAHADGTLTGARFEVRDGAAGEPHGREHGRADVHEAAHLHVHWSDIRTRIEAAGLSEGVTRHAIGIFGCLADAEARVHGVAPGDVAFHEIGAFDSVADIVAAAWLIDAVGPATWSVASLPLGGGRMRTAHGIMPVPAPATALLLEGFATYDDGIGGERVTPTGAAILRHLGASPGRSGGMLRASGFGFGTRRLPGLSNCLRVLVFDSAAAAAAAAAPPEHRELAVISFEVDDQSGEDLAAGLDRVRAGEGIHEVVQMAAFGKKGRMAVHVQVLARPDALEAAVDACFRETTTIGLRTHLVHGRALPRRFAHVAVDGQDVRVKLVDRPGGGMTAKAESDHLLGKAGHDARTRLRRAAERQAETT